MPEDAGSIYLSAFHHLGQGVGRVIENAQNEHQKNENLFGKAAQLHEMGFIPDKEWNPIAQMYSRHQAINQGRLEALTQLYGAVALTGAKAKLDEDKFTNRQQEILARQEELESFKQRTRGTAAPKETTEEKEIGKVVGKEKARTSLLQDAITNPMNVAYGRFATDAEIQSGAVAKPAAGEPGSFVPTESGKAPQPVVRITSQSGRSYVMPRDQFEKLQKQFDPDQIKADYQAGTITREEALKRLRSLPKFKGKKKKASQQTVSDNESDSDESDESDESDDSDDS